MSDTVVNASPASPAPAATTGLLLDGDPPRLGTAQPAPEMPNLPTAAPVITPSTAPEMPNLPTAAPVITPGSTPSLPTPAPAAAPTNDSPSNDSAPTTGEHPMAHLMPSKTMPTEASRRAAEQRAAQKAKSKKIKIGVISGIIVVTAVVGPPLGKWLVDAINEVGATTVEQPAE